MDQQASITRKSLFFMLFYEAPQQAGIPDTLKKLSVSDAVVRVFATSVLHICGAPRPDLRARDARPEYGMGGLEG